MLFILCCVAKRIVKIMIRYFITDCRKFHLYGDMMFDGKYGDNSYYMPWIGSRIQVKLLGLFWVRYKQFRFR